MMSALSSRGQRGGLVLIAAVLVCSNASAQFNNQWATFVKDTNRIRNPDGSIATHVTTDPQEKDYAFGDVNRDGWTDLVVVRKGHSSSNVKALSQLLLNENGVLVDRTSAYGVDSTVPGDFGLLTPTCNRDVQLVDIDGDGWLDLVTAVALSDGDPKWLSHPRVYRNKGSAGGTWQGFRYEEFRIPQLLTIHGGLAVAPRFVSVSVGDVTGDGFADLYFTDHDSTPGYLELTANDLNDRLLINDGLGNFMDSLETLVSPVMLQSGFGIAANIVDANGDGARDIFKLTAQPGPPAVKLAYNPAPAVGTFAPTGNLANNAPYNLDVGDLNRDGRPDIAIGDDGADTCRFNLGNDTAGQVIWGPQRPYSFLSGFDDGFVGQIRIVDLDGDSWPETIHADVDAEVTGCDRRCHIYHNLGGVIGSEVVLREEAEMSSTTSGWKGAVGLLPSELAGTFDVAPFDIDNDGDIDLVLGRCAGTTVWINQAAQPGTVTCVGDGSGAPCPCGNQSPVGDNGGCLSSISLPGKLRSTGFTYVTADSSGLVATGLPNSAPGLFVQSSSSTSGSAYGDGLLCLSGASIRLGVVFASGNTSAYPRPGLDPAVSVQGLVTAGDVRTYQLWYRDSVPFCASETFNLTNALTLTWQH